MTDIKTAFCGCALGIIIMDILRRIVLKKHVIPDDKSKITLSTGIIILLGVALAQPARGHSDRFGAFERSGDNSSQLWHKAFGNYDNPRYPGRNSHIGTLQACR